MAVGLPGMGVLRVQENAREAADVPAMMKP